MRSLSFTRDVFFELSVLVRLMNSTATEKALVAGCTKAYPLWWRLSRRAWPLLASSMAAYAQLFDRVEWTHSGPTAVLLNPVNFALFLILWISITACLEASIYPSLAGDLIARNRVPYASFFVGMGAYIICGWRAAGAEFIFAGAVPLVPVLVHCTLSAIYPCDIEKLEKELSKIYNVKDMGSWLFHKNYYKPELSTIRQLGSRWKGILEWIKDADCTFTENPTLWLDNKEQIMELIPETYQGMLADRPAVIVDCAEKEHDDLNVRCSVSVEQAEKLLASKAALVFSKKEAEKFQTYSRESPESGRLAEFKQKFDRVMDNQPNRQTKLRYHINDIGKVCDFPFRHPLRNGVRLSKVFVFFSLVASVVTHCVPHDGSKVVSGFVALGLTYFSDVSGTFRWAQLHYHLLKRGAGTLSSVAEAKTPVGLVVIFVIVVWAALSDLLWSTDEGRTTLERFVAVFVPVAIAAPGPSLFASAWGSFLEDCAPHEVGTWIQPDGSVHGYTLFMKEKVDGFKHYLRAGDAFVVGSHRLLFSKVEGKRFDVKCINGELTVQDFSVDSDGNACLFQVG